MVLNEKKIGLGFLSSVVLLMAFLFVTPSASANGLNEGEEPEVSYLFTNFVNKMFENPEKSTVLDSNNKNITKKFIEDNYNYYTIKDYKSIQDVIVNENLSVAYESVQDLTLAQQKNLGITPNSSIRGQSASKQFYHIATESKGKFRKEWVVTLSGSFSYNTSTYQVVSAGSPTIRLTTANFGAAFAPALEAVSTSGSYSGKTATFTGRYQMRAVLGVSVGDLPLGFNLNFGNFTDKFTANPSVLY